MLRITIGHRLFFDWRFHLKHVITPDRYDLSVTYLYTLNDMSWKNLP